MGYNYQPGSSYTPATTSVVKIGASSLRWLLVTGQMISYISASKEAFLFQNKYGIIYTHDELIYRLL